MSKIFVLTFLSFMHSNVVQNVERSDVSRNVEERAIINGYKSVNRLFYVRLTFGWKYCGGSIIGENIILTAAHCIYPNTSITVQYGDFTSREGWRVTLETTAVRVNEGFVRDSLLNDVAVIKTDGMLPRNRIIPLCKEKEPAGTDLRACGIGLTVTQYPIKSSKILMETTFEEPQNSSECRADRICPVVTEKSTCMGDSGGPLYAVKGGKVKCLYGVSSAVVSVGTGKFCNAGSYFTNIPHFYHWIVDAKNSLLVNSSTNTSSAR
ncbi:trypsin-like isoform X2 [Convolutriloba macropyga]|uniref:trypsin-like isoform X2 n=1 Tax=Convolutriloba macropyga TaxID=536237 RepID=UPI003F522ABA